VSRLRRRHPGACRFGAPAAAILFEAMPRLTLFTTEPCSFCRNAKALLQKRGVPYDEINLAKDPIGRAELVRRTGLMTFPQIVVDGETLGGFRELLQADQAGALEDLAAAA
jgi:glutaredoxin 3